MKLTGDFYIGLFTALIIWPVVGLVLVYGIRSIIRLWVNYLSKTPVISWFGLILVVGGLKLVRKQHLGVMTYEGRWWFSPKSLKFKSDPDLRDRIL